MSLLTGMNHVIGMQCFQGMHDLSNDTLHLGDTESLRWRSLLELPHVGAHDWQNKTNMSAVRPIHLKVVEDTGKS
jgi:hypothetical protein